MAAAVGGAIVTRMDIEEKDGGACGAGFGAATGGGSTASGRAAAVVRRRWRFGRALVGASSSAKP
jgi:hypothetical protein